MNETQISQKHFLVLVRRVRVHSSTKFYLWRVNAKDEMHAVILTLDEFKERFPADEVSAYGVLLASGLRDVNLAMVVLSDNLKVVEVLEPEVEEGSNASQRTM